MAIAAERHALIDFIDELTFFSANLEEFFIVDIDHGGMGMHCFHVNATIGWPNSRTQSH
jgi:hypothetical protein